MTLDDLILGDCMEIMPTMRDGSVDLVLTDPPFFLPARHYAARKEWPRSLSDLSILETYYRGLFAELRRVLKVGGHLLMFCDAQSYPVFFSCAYPLFHNVVALTWDKGKIGLGTPWRNQSEFILAATDTGVRLNATQGTVLRFSTIPSAQRQHPAQKPLDLLEHLIRLTVPEGGVVLDPFMGVGSTGFAAERVGGLRFIGIEMNANYHACAVESLCDIWAAG